MKKLMLLLIVGLVIIIGFFAGLYFLLLAEDETVRRHLSPEDIAAKLDPEAYTGSCAAIATAQAKRARTVAGELAG